MAVQLVINEEMIDCFHSCTEKGNYGPLFDNHGPFFKCLIENIRNVKFLGTSFSRDISNNLPYIFNHIKNFAPNTRITYDCKNRVTYLLEKLDDALISKNWSIFYEQYRNLADSMVRAARKQGVMDFRIKNGSSMHESFLVRELVMNCGFSANQMFEEPNSHNVENPNGAPGLGVIEPISRPGVEQLGLTTANGVEEVPKVTMEPKTENLQANQSEAIIQLESTFQRIVEKVDLIQIELNKNLNLNILKENLKTMETNQKNFKADFEQELNKINVLLNEKILELSSKNQEIDEKTGKAINLIQSDMKNITQKQLEMEHAVKQIDGSIATLKADLMKKMEMIEKNVEDQKDQLKLKEDLLNKKIVEMLTREDALNDKMEAKEESLDRKIEEVKAKEQLLDKKIDAMLELMELFKQQNQPKEVAADCSENSDRCINSSDIESTDRFQAKSEATEPDPRNCTSNPDLITSGSLSIQNLLDDDEEIRQIQEKFKKEEAEQTARHAAEMKALKDGGRQRNEKAQEEIRELSRSVSRARDQSSFRS